MIEKNANLMGFVIAGNDDLFSSQFLNRFSNEKTNAFPFRRHLNKRTHINTKAEPFRPQIDAEMGYYQQNPAMLIREIIKEIARHCSIITKISSHVCSQSM